MVGKMWYTKGVNKMPITLRQQPPALLQRGAIAMSTKHTTLNENDKYIGIPHKVGQLLLAAILPTLQPVVNRKIEC